VTGHATGRGTGLEATIVVERDRFRLDVTIEVRPGETVAVLGPNGAGKTTLLRALAGLVPLTAGLITLDGRVLEDPARGVNAPPQRRGVGFVFQDYLLFAHLSALDNIGFGSRARHGLSRRESREQAREWLERFGLGEVARRRPGELSGGQAQRVALARALAPAPGLLLLDEPLAALDAATRLDIRSHLRTVLAELAVPALLVTHDPLDAMTLADRLLIVEGGRLAQQGPPVEIACRPRTDYVARLVGLNLYAGTVTAADRDGATGGATVALDGGGELGVKAGPAVGSRVFVAARPSDVTLHPNRPDDAGATVVRGRVASIEPRAEGARVTLDAVPPVRADVTAAALAERRLTPGGEVWATIGPDALNVYPERPADAN
jgi:molybdate transport system ATP-binding protein